MAFNFSGLEPSGIQIRDIPAPSNLNDREKLELARKMKGKMINSEKEAGSSSSSAQPCFVALVTTTNLQEDALCLPQDFTSSIGLKRECHKTVIKYGERRSWTFDLRFSIFSGTFHMSRGWKAFCEENGKQAGGFFIFKLVENGETLLLSLGPTESVNDGAQGDSNMREYSMELEREKKRQFMKLRVVPDSLNRGRQYLKASVMRKNGITSPMTITLVGKDGTKWLANMRGEHKGRMCLGKGWKEFAKENGLKTGDIFTFELVWENGTPMLSLFREARKRQVERGESSSSAKQNKNRFVSLTLTREDVRDCILVLPNHFLRANGINQPGKIMFVGKNNMEWPAFLLKKGMVSVGYGWKKFCEVNGVKIGDSFLLEATDVQDTLKFCAQVFL